MWREYVRAARVHKLLVGFAFDKSRNFFTSLGCPIAAYVILSIFCPKQCKIGRRSGIRKKPIACKKITDRFRVLEPTKPCRLINHDLPLGHFADRKMCSPQG